MNMNIKEAQSIISETLEEFIMGLTAQDGNETEIETIQEALKVLIKTSDAATVFIEEALKVLIKTSDAATVFIEADKRACS